MIEKLKSTLPEKIFIYLGDGIGDYCPSLKLREEDHVLPRKNFPVWDLISKSPMLIKAKIHEWTDGQELEHVLLQTIDEICVGFAAEKDEDTQMMIITGDCKLQTMSSSSSLASAGANKPLHRALTMPQ